MAQETQNQQQQQQQQPQGKICNGDCFGCSYQQAWMCTSMHTLRTLKMVAALNEEVQALRSLVAELQAKFADEPAPPVIEETEKKKK